MPIQPCQQNDPFAYGATRLQLLARAGCSERFIGRRIREDSLCYLIKVESRRTHAHGGPERYYHELASEAYSGLRFEKYSSVNSIHALAMGHSFQLPTQPGNSIISWGQVNEADAVFVANRVILHEHSAMAHALFTAHQGLEVDTLEGAVTYRQLGDLYAGQKCFVVEGERPSMLFLRGQDSPRFDGDSVKAVTLSVLAATTPFISRLLTRQGIPTILVEG